MQDIVEALCGMTQESFRARCECREGDVVVCMGKPSRGHRANSSHGALPDKNLIDLIQDVAHELALALRGRPGKPRRGGRGRHTRVLSEPDLGHPRQCAQALAMLLHLPFRMSAAAGPVGRALKAKGWALQTRLVRLARECITAAASFPTLSRLNHPDSQATRRDLRCAVDAAALLAHALHALRWSLGWTREGQPAGASDKEAHKQWRVVADGLAAGEGDGEGEEGAPMVGVALAACADAVGACTRAMAEESLAGHWTRALARHARSSIALLDALCAVPRFYNTLLDCPDAPSHVLSLLSRAVRLHEAASRQEQVDCAPARADKPPVPRDRGECELCAAEVMALVLTLGGYDSPHANFCDHVFERCRGQAEGAFADVWRCAGGVMLRGALSDPRAWPLWVPGTGQFDLNVLRVAEMLGNDGNWRKQGMEELAGPIAAWLCGCPFLLRSKACCGKEALDLHSIDGEPVMSPTYTMHRIWAELTVAGRTLLGAPRCREMAVAVPSAVERACLLFKLPGNLHSWYEETVPWELKGYFAARVAEVVRAAAERAERSRRPSRKRPRPSTDPSPSHHARARTGEAISASETASTSTSLGTTDDEGWGGGGGVANGARGVKREEGGVRGEGGGGAGVVQERGGAGLGGLGETWHWSTAHPGTVMAVNVWQLVRCAREIQKASPSLEPPLITNEEVLLVSGFLRDVLSRLSPPPSPSSPSPVPEWAPVMSRIEVLECEELDHVHGIIMRPESSGESGEWAGGADVGVGGGSEGSEGDDSDGDSEGGYGEEGSGGAGAAGDDL